ncbi:DEAD/DEAH box helicase family protein [Olsenella sp. An270]|uniref:DEAD/DEAH box helicase family protein n=1 Tax=Olsenella sp. An270 TaxID=1965615 RepID=UPI000B387FB2|nr:DEAD/DEAH box helicase family protein [Olsenella sp. An270]OUO59819.1 DEAD/DEAH box helicase [Olsenella sp. An270]
MNFDFLKTRAEYAMFAPACAEAERTLSTSPAMCAVGCRKAFELAVKWVYAADSSLTMPYKDNLSSLIHEASFQRVVDRVTWRTLPFIVKLGNKSVHTDRRVSPQDALLALKALFGFVQWIDYCYGGDAYEERVFDEHKVPLVKLALDVQAIKQREALLAQKEDVIRRQEEEIKQLRSQFAAAKAQAIVEDDFNPDTISERETRRRYIDLDIEYAGWDLERNVETEVEVQGMPNSRGVGYIDYVLNGADGKPLAIVEAKRTMHDTKKGLQQARLYAQCLEMRYGYAPFIFLSNGFETYFCDDISGSERPCSGVFSPEDLQRLTNRRGIALPLSSMRVNQDIAGRYYQIEAIRAICANMEEGHRRNLLVMATGTGKTRTAAGLVDVLTRANWASNVLFLADRVALVSQAKAAFQEYLPNLSLCNLCSTKDRMENSSARMVFSTYPSILNAIDTVKMGDGRRIFTPAHFDLIIVDEAHRSIFKKYRAIFDYFDAQVLGLTATPKDEVDRNTYDFFEVERGVPTYVYEYDTAVKQDHYLVPYYNIEVATKFLDEGISYDDLTEEDRERLDDDWEEAYGEDVAAPEFMPSSALNSWVFNEKTVDTVLQDLMENGAKVAGGERLGKTIIFAKNKKHAQFVVDRFNALYPKRGGFARRVVHGDDYSDTIIEDFKFKEMPVIAVSVDKMDTGIDVPQVLNLVFFKQVHSKTKFWQMIGRGTRLCPDLMVTDCLDGEYLGKRRFFIFDYCGNFEFFRQGKDVAEGKNPESLSERVFKRKVAIVEALQNPAFSSGDYQTWRGELIGEIVRAVGELRAEPLKVAVKLHLHAIERFSSESAFLSLNKGDVGELEREVAPLIVLDESDQYALRFDALMYGYMVAVLLGESVDAYRRRVVDLAFRLQHKMTIPQVKERKRTIALVVEEDYLEHADALMLEGVRTELRSLIKFLIDGSELPALVTSLTDPVISRREGEEISPGEDFADYRLKVNRYVIDHGDMTVIHKLRNNIPMTELEYRELERVFMEELGSEADYRRTYGETPLGLLVRRIAKLDHDAAMEAFAEFINDESLSQQQMAFVHRVVDYVEQNGYMDPSALMKTPFDRPVSFFRLFDDGRQKRLVQIINQVRENALTPVA